MKKFSRPSSAFTLIELLASLGIIAVLSALVMAGVGKAKRGGETASSVASLRTISAAMLSVAQDNDGLIPELYGGQNPGYQNNDLKRMPARLWSYISSPEPASSYNYAKAFMPAAYKRQYKSISGLGITYLVYNPNTKDAEGNVSNAAGKPLSAVVLPSKNYMLVEADQDLWDVAPAIMGAKPGWIGNLSKQALNHPLRGVAYWDGRVEMASASKPFATQ